jgi:proteasome lid subunit RPN8/RPN11
MTGGMPVVAATVAAVVAAPVGGVDPAAGAAPTLPVWVALPAAIHDAIVAHARSQAPNEMCGFIVGTAAPADGGAAQRWEPARNAAESPLRFEVASEDLVRLTLEIDGRGEVVWAVVHSHVRSPAIPSAADVAGASHADALHVLVSLATAEADPATGSPSVRAWRLADGAGVEVGLEVR